MIVIDALPLLQMVGLRNVRVRPRSLEDDHPLRDPSWRTEIILGKYSGRYFREICNRLSFCENTDHNLTKIMRAYKFINVIMC